MHPFLRAYAAVPEWITASSTKRPDTPIRVI